MAGRSTFEPRLRLFLAIAVAAAGIFVLLISRSVDTVNLPLTILRLESSTVGGVGIALITTSAVLYFLPPPLAFSTTLFIYLSLLATGIGYRPPQRGDRSVALPTTTAPTKASGDPSAPRPKPERVWASDTEWFDRYQWDDPKFGWRGYPRMTSQHAHKDFGQTVTYTFDDEGNRKIDPPRSATPAGEILIVGCSHTFGVGVPDTGTYAAILAREAWPDYRIRNLACAGWGTAQVVLAVEEEFAKGHRPKAVFYGWIEQHIERNYLRASVRKRNMNKPFPLFEVEGDNLVHRGLASLSQAVLPDNKQTEAQEIALALALLKRLEELCSQHRIPLIIVELLPYPSALLDEFARKRPVLLLTAGPQVMQFYPREGHLTARAHRDVAGVIASDPRVSDWIGIPALNRPLAVGRRPPTWMVAFDQEKGATVDWQTTETGARINRITSPPGVRWHPTLELNGIRAIPGKAHQLTFRARSDSPRTITALLRGHLNGKSTVLAASEVQLQGPWQQVALTLTPTEYAYNMSLNFGGANSAVPFEIADVRWIHDGKDLLSDGIVRPQPLEVSTLSK